jgi:hypothetical protein
MTKEQTGAFRLVVPVISIIVIYDSSLRSMLVSQGGVYYQLQLAADLHRVSSPRLLLYSLVLTPPFSLYYYSCFLAFSRLLVPLRKFAHTSHERLSAKLACIGGLLKFSYIRCVDRADYIYRVPIVPTYDRLCENYGCV